MKYLVIVLMVSCTTVFMEEAPIRPLAEPVSGEDKVMAERVWLECGNLDKDMPQVFISNDPSYGFEARAQSYVIGDERVVLFEEDFTEDNLCWAFQRGAL